jgi:hypothetical protein
MPYGKVDELAINTIRTLAVRLPMSRCCPTSLSQNSYPAIAIFFPTLRRRRIGEPLLIQ